MKYKVSVIERKRLFHVHVKSNKDRLKQNMTFVLINVPLTCMILPITTPIGDIRFHCKVLINSNDK